MSFDEYYKIGMLAELRYLRNSTHDVILQDSTGIQSITSMQSN